MGKKDNVATAAAVPQGFALVPLNPDDAMQAAGAQAVRMDTTALNRIWTANAVFRAMVNAAPTPTVAADAAAPTHADDTAVDEFAAVMKEKLAQARAKGRGGWETCNPADLSRMLREHVEKGDPRDVANFCMFLWSLEAPISKAAQPDERAAFDLPPLPAPLEIDWPELHSHALGCGVEDRNIRDRYEAAEYGWQDGADRAAERVPEEIFTADQMREYALAAVARATAPQATLMKLAESNAELRAQIERYQAICASAYQLAGAVDAPLRFLDVLASSANGEPVSEKAALDLLPITVEEYAAVPKGTTLTNEQRIAIEAALSISDAIETECHDGSFLSEASVEALRALLATHPTEQAGK